MLDDSVSQRKKGCQLSLLPAVPTAGVTAHKGERRKETTSEDRRQEGCHSRDKGRAQRAAGEVSTALDPQPGSKP